MLKLLKKNKKSHVFLIKEVSLQRGSYAHIVRQAPKCLAHNYLPEIHHYLIIIL